MRRKLYYRVTIGECPLTVFRCIRGQIRRTITCGLFVFVVGACGPPLSEPSSVDASGDWSSRDQIGAVSNISLSLSQSVGGELTGTWAGTLSPPNATCPPNLGSPPGGSVSGTNTVLEVRFDIMGVGIFEGQIVDPSELRGSIQSCESIYALTFSRTTGTAP